MILTLSTIESYSVNKSLEVDNCCISLCYRTICNCNCSCIFVSLVLKLSVNLFIRNWCVNLCNCNAHVLTKSNLRSYSNLCCVDERLSLLNLSNLNCRTWNNVNTTLVNRTCVCLLHKDICCILVEHTCSIHFLNHSSWHFSFTESRYTNLFLLLLICRIQCFL